MICFDFNQNVEQSYAAAPPRVGLPERYRRPPVGETEWIRCAVRTVRPRMIAVAEPIVRKRMSMVGIAVHTGDVGAPAISRFPVRVAHIDSPSLCEGDGTR